MDNLIVTLVISLIYFTGVRTVQVIVTTDSGIFLTDIQSNKTSLLSNKHTEVHSFDYHYKKSYLFFVSNNQLKRLHFNTTKENGLQVMSIKNITKDDSVQSVAVDWIQDRLYWTKSNRHGVRVMESTLSGRHPKHIITKEDLDRNHILKNAHFLGDMVVDPDKGLLFVIVARKNDFIGTIVRINLQSLSDFALIEAGLHNARSIAIDTHLERLFVTIKSGKTFFSCDYDGGNVYMRSGLNNIFTTLSVSENNLYYVTKQNLLNERDESWAIAESRKRNTIFATNFSNIHAIKVFAHRNQQIELKYDQQLCRQKHCLDGCQVNSNQEVFCTCPAGYDLATDGISCEDTELDASAHVLTTIRPRDPVNYYDGKSTGGDLVDNSTETIVNNYKTSENSSSSSHKIILFSSSLLLICIISVLFFILKANSKQSTININSSRVLMTQLNGDEERLIVNI